MRSKAFLLACLLLAAYPLYADPITEAEVKARIDAARNELAEARSAMADANAEMDLKRTALASARQDWNALQDQIRFLEEKIESANNSLLASVGHQDRELKRYQDKLQRLLRQNGPADEIEEARRYVRAYENWRATRLRKNGLNEWISALQRQLAAKKAEQAALRQTLQSAIQSTKAAEAAI